VDDRCGQPEYVLVARAARLRAIQCGDRAPPFLLSPARASLRQKSAIQCSPYSVTTTTSPNMY
jgi:hypothetical protein